jgi:chromatin remodeling complex protein RSC6
MNSVINPQHTVEEQFSSLFLAISDMSKTCKVLQEDLKNLQKSYRVVEKDSRKRPKRIQIKMKISKELSKFLGNYKDDLTKAEAMKMISAYIKENNLQLDENKRKFLPNKELLKLFGLKTAYEMTFVEINKNISPHLSK